ncbi:MAG: hypothetical protein OXG26_19550 [Caldilineaceae bacterium]|nr:hypothetical protein [Caldilineaceae bacterium]
MTRSQQTALFPDNDVQSVSRSKKGTTTERLKRIDTDVELRELLLPYCRLKYGDIWEDPVSGHRVGVLDATEHADVDRIMSDRKSGLLINDPPYNVMVGNANTANLSKIDLTSYLDFSQMWVSKALQIAKPNAHLYVWIGADYKDNFQPLPDFMILMREFRDFSPRNLITVRRLEHYRETGRTGWQWHNPFPEIDVKEGTS